MTTAEAIPTDPYSRLLSIVDRNLLGRHRHRHPGKCVAPRSPEGSLTKKGEPELRRLLFNAAMQGRRNPHWQPYYLALRERGLSSTAAFVALGRKITRLCFVLLRKEVDFQPNLHPGACMATWNPSLARIAAYYAARSPRERRRIASGLYDTARAIIASSLPPDLSDEERRYAILKRLHGDELPEAARRSETFIPLEIATMPRNVPARAVRKAISLPADLARFAMTTAREKGVLTERQLDRYLGGKD